MATSVMGSGEGVGQYNSKRISGSIFIRTAAIEMVTVVMPFFLGSIYLIGGEETTTRTYV